MPPLTLVYVPSPTTLGEGGCRQGKGAEAGATAGDIGAGVVPGISPLPALHSGWPGLQLHTPECSSASNSLGTSGLT